jgi:hypothetical protein
MAEGTFNYHYQFSIFSYQPTATVCGTFPKKAPQENGSLIRLNHLPTLGDLPVQITDAGRKLILLLKRLQKQCYLLIQQKYKKYTYTITI